MHLDDADDVDDVAAISSRPYASDTAALIRRLPELLTFDERRVAKVAARLKTAGKDGRWADGNPLLLLQLMQRGSAADYIRDMPAEVLRQAAAAAAGAGPA